MVIQVSVDESGYCQTGREEVFVFAGYAGTVLQWEDFTHKWLLVMNESPNWNAQILKNRVRDKNDSGDRLLRLVEAISDSGIHRVSLKLPSDEFQKIIGKIGLQEFEHPYFHAFLALNLLLVRSIRNYPNTTIEFIYDENVKERQELQNGYSNFISFLKRKRPDILTLFNKNPVPRNDNNFMPLQAADMLAWNMHRDYVEHHKGRTHNSNVWNALKEIPYFVDEVWDSREVVGQFLDLVYSGS